MLNKMLRFVIVIYLALTSISEAAVFGNRIIGGHDANIQDYPYQLSLRSHGSHFCGASIISQYWALTAAQCVDGVKDVESITVVAGSSLLSKGGEVHVASKIIEHANYEPVFKDYDIALIKVKTPFNIGSGSIHIIQLPGDNENIIVGELVDVSGWGYTTQGGSLSEQLKSVLLPIVEQEECIKDYPKQPVTERMLCAGLDIGGKDSCDGDSGGPMLYKGKQIGIVSWGNGCAGPKHPGVYTNVVQLRQWIRDNAGF